MYLRDTSHLIGPMFGCRVVILVDNNVGTSLQPGHHLGGHSAKEPSVFSQSQTLRPSPNRKHILELYHLRHVPCNLCVGVYNLKKALVVIVKSSRRLVCSSSESVGHVYSGHLTWSPSVEGGGGHCGYQAAFHAGPNIVIAHIYNLQLTGF